MRRKQRRLIDELQPDRGVFVPDQYKETVEKHKLTGFKLCLAWDSDRTERKRKKA